MQRRFEAPRPEFDRRFVKAITLVGDDGLELDLHRAVTPGPFGVLCDAREFLAAPPDRIRLGGRTLQCLPADLALVQACAHAALGDPEPRFVSVRDVAQILHHGIDDAAAIARFEQFRAGVVAQRAIALVERVLGVISDSSFAEWARARRGTRTDHWRLRSYADGGNRYARQAAATFWVLPTMRDRVAYASALAFPTRAYLDARATTYPRRLARSAALVLRGRPR
jgi:hypothetical protein